MLTKSELQVVTVVYTVLVVQLWSQRKLCIPLTCMRDYERRKAEMKEGRKERRKEGKEKLLR